MAPALERQMDVELDRLVRGLTGESEPPLVLAATDARIERGGLGIAGVGRLFDVELEKGSSVDPSAAGLFRSGAAVLRHAIDCTESRRCFAAFSGAWSLGAATARCHTENRE
jgi:hypothetical protein